MGVLEVLQAVEGVSEVVEQLFGDVNGVDKRVVAQGQQGGGKSQGFQFHVYSVIFSLIWDFIVFLQFDIWFDAKKTVSYKERMVSDDL